jgi:hypothetical protein
VRKFCQKSLVKSLKAFRYILMNSQAHLHVNSQNFLKKCFASLASNDFLSRSLLIWLLPEHPQSTLKTIASGTKFSDEALRKYFEAEGCCQVPRLESAIVAASVWQLTDPLAGSYGNAKLKSKTNGIQKRKLLTHNQSSFECKEDSSELLLRRNP